MFAQGKYCDHHKETKPPTFRFFSYQAIFLDFDIYLDNGMHKCDKLHIAGATGQQRILCLRRHLILTLSY